MSRFCDDMTVVTWEWNGDDTVGFDLDVAGMSDGGNFLGMIAKE